jgi:hypothetical protein
MLTYRILLERFNDKYSNLNSKQKRILKEFIEAVDSTSHLRDFYNNEVKLIKKDLNDEIKKSQDKAIKIKLNEVSKLINELSKKEKVKSDHLVDLLQYHSLLEELLSSHVKA